MTVDSESPEYWEELLAEEGMPPEPHRKRNTDGRGREIPVAPAALFIGEPLVVPEDDGWLRDDVVNVVETLPEPHRLCITLSLYGQMSLREIEEETGIPKTTVSVRLDEALDMLKVRLLQNTRIKEKIYGESRSRAARCASGALECWGGTCERDDCPKCDCIPGSLAEIGGRQEEGDRPQLLDYPRPRGA